jgi:hypothetical protein
MVNRAPTPDATAASASAATTRRASKPAAAKTAATPWGPARVVDKVTLVQRAGEKRFATVVELLETRSEEGIVRFAYATDGVARRGPVTLRARDLQRLWTELEKRPALAAALGRPTGGDA